jgi:hypothetical protein
MVRYHTARYLVEESVRPFALHITRLADGAQIAMYGDDADLLDGRLIDVVWNQEGADFDAVDSVCSDFDDLLDMRSGNR